MKILGFLIFYAAFTAMARADSFQPVANGFAKSKSDPAQVLISVIDVDTAEKLFKKFAANKGIPFAYPAEDCEARTTAMSRIAEVDGILMGRLYFEGELVAKTKSANYPVVYWRRHIVPVAFVAKPGAEPQLMTFDPALFDHPTTVEALRLKILTKLPGEDDPYINEEYFGSRFQYNINAPEPSRSAWNAHDLKESAATLKKDLRLQDKTSKDLPPRIQEDPGADAGRGPAGSKNSARSSPRLRSQKPNN